MGLSRSSLSIGKYTCIHSIKCSLNKWLYLFKDITLRVLGEEHSIKIVQELSSSLLGQEQLNSLMKIFLLLTKTAILCILQHLLRELNNLLIVIKCRLDPAKHSHISLQIHDLLLLNLPDSLTCHDTAPHFILLLHEQLQPLLKCLVLILQLLHLFLLLPLDLRIITINLILLITTVLFNLRLRGLRQLDLRLLLNNPEILLLLLAHVADLHLLSIGHLVRQIALHRRLDLLLRIVVLPRLLLEPLQDILLLPDPRPHSKSEAIAFSA